MNLRIYVGKLTFHSKGQNIPRDGRSLLLPYFKLQSLQKLSNVVYAAFPTSHTIYSILQGALIIYLYLVIIVCLIISSLHCKIYTHLLRGEFYFYSSAGRRRDVIGLCLS